MQVRYINTPSEPYVPFAQTATKHNRAFRALLAPRSGISEVLVVAWVLVRYYIFPELKVLVVISWVLVLVLVIVYNN